MRPYGEVLNDIRADKNVSISAIEQFGISKSRWYRFVAGEAELSLKELIDVLTLLTMTFSELAMAVKVPLFRPFSTVSMFAMSLDQLKTDVIGTEKTVAEDGPDDYGYQVAQMVLGIRENGRYDPTLFASLKELLLETESYTIFELNVAGLLAYGLTPKEFMIVYQRFARSITMFNTFLPIDVWGIAMQMHVQAIKKFLIDPNNRNRENTRFILEAIINQPATDDTVELKILRRLAMFVRDDEMLENPALDDLVKAFLDAAERERASVVGLAPSDLNLALIWQIYRAERDSFWQPATTDEHFPVYAAGTEVPYFEHFGKLFQWVVQGKHITTGTIDRAGVSTYKLYRAYKDPDLLRSDDMTVLMRVLRLLPADLDAVVYSQYIDTTHTTWVQYVPELTDPAMYHVMAEVALKNYERLGTRRDLEVSFEYRALDGMARYPGWLSSPMANQLGREIMDELMSIDVWHDHEVRLVKFGLLAIDSLDMIDVWAKQMRRVYEKSYEPYRLIENILEALDLATFRAALLGNRELVAYYTLLARDLGREQVRDGSLWLQWRWAMLDYYEWFFDDPTALVSMLSNFVVDYQTLTGNFAMMMRYRSILQALGKQPKIK
ncbi:helix-turn-helix transcriptional regulator [Weissella cibaria]|uniref:helix-turn-helix transcriptional regulator n=1 Tax=Weissella cibaria TaxID=137591 RepID=UPI000D0B2BE2|nr:helix-turn-helix transcriptional regulator [Weissella cibaria]AVO67365.1 XRE family transcriptional regulator [Weissella cibaria]MCT0021688.1 XRE family transcriptional regulator [Weissella cibaria]UOX37366.1 helix-turn-helix transcriptional regulator [Weissella cibaria]